MSSTYLELCNRVLRRIGEVTMTDTDFASVRGVQALVKDAVNDAINRLNAVKFEWPFNAYEHTIRLDEGVSEYAWPDAFKRADWNSFQIQKDTTLNVQSSHLKFINRDEWYSLYRDEDTDNGIVGTGFPRFVFKSHGNGFGITPAPDAEYTIKYRYWITPPQLVNFDDTTTIPVEFEYVIIDATLFIMNMYRENDNTLNVINTVIEDGIANMVTVLLTNYEHMTDTRVPNGR